MARQFNLQLLLDMQEFSVRATRIANDVLSAELLSRNFNSSNLHQFVGELQAAKRFAVDLRNRLDVGTHLWVLAADLAKKYECACDSAEGLVDFGQIYRMTKADVVDANQGVDKYEPLLSALAATAWNLLVFTQNRHMDAVNYVRHVTGIFNCPPAA